VKAYTSLRAFLLEVGKLAEGVLEIAKVAVNLLCGESEHGAWGTLGNLGELT
jgi:hypothetical protein